MNEIVEKAQQAIATSEVQEILKKLSEYGLGVFMPHMHDPETGDFAPLPSGMVAVEDNLQVSFHHASEPEVSNARPVGWVWDNSSQTAMVCTYCIEFSGRHSKNKHT